jgi:hypothetical protein
MIPGREQGNLDHQCSRTRHVSTWFSVRGFITLAEPVKSVLPSDQVEEADIGHDALSNLVATSPESPVPKHTTDMATILHAMSLCHYLLDVALLPNL